MTLPRSHLLFRVLSIDHGGLDMVRSGRSERNKMSKQKTAAIDNRANQLNPCHKAYHLSRGVPSSGAEKLVRRSKPVRDNRSRQLSHKSIRPS